MVAAWNGHDHLDEFLRQNFALEESMMRSFDHPSLPQLSR
jgi:hypothetical protein